MNTTVKGGPGGFMIVLALFLAVTGWSSRAWNPPEPGQPPFPADTAWIESAPTRGGPVLFAFPGPPKADELMDALGRGGGPPPPAGIPDHPVKIVTGHKTAIRPLSGAAALTLGLKMNVNQADARDLQLLPGIGPVTAGRIVRNRTGHGPFSSLEDLARVEGIGPRTIENVRPFAATE